MTTIKAKVALGLVAAGLVGLLITVALAGPGGTHETDVLMGVYPGVGMEGYMADLPATVGLTTTTERQAYARQIVEADQRTAIMGYVEPVADDWSRMLAWLLLMAGITAAAAVARGAHLRRLHGFGVREELPFTRQL
jgi:hypothetical protein